MPTIRAASVQVQYAHAILGASATTSSPFGITNANIGVSFFDNGALCARRTRSHMCSNAGTLL